MLIALFLLRPGFVGRARTWWTIALIIQFWHHIEHLLLLIQAQTHTFFFGQSVPTSIAQLVVPRVELHLFYNSIVFIPMVVAVYLHQRRHPASSRAGSAQPAIAVPAGGRVSVAYHVTFTDGAELAGSFRAMTRSPGAPVTSCRYRRKPPSASSPTACTTRCRTEPVLSGCETW